MLGQLAPAYLQLQTIVVVHLPKEAPGAQTNILLFPLLDAVNSIKLQEFTVRIDMGYLAGDTLGDAMDRALKRLSKSPSQRKLHFLGLQPTHPIFFLRSVSFVVGGFFLRTKPWSTSDEHVPSCTVSGSSAVTQFPMSSLP